MYAAIPKRSGHARDHFEGNAGFRQRFHLFPAPSEDKRVATFESHYRLPLRWLCAISRSDDFRL